MITRKDVFKKAYLDPAWGAEKLSKRPLRGFQAEIITRAEEHIARHQGGVMTIQASRQIGKNDLAALLQLRHLWVNQNKQYKSSWVRTAPTHEPQIVTSKQRLDELMMIDRKGLIRHPMFDNQKLIKSEGYIWRLGSATVEFMSSGPQSNVVGATASACLDMDEAHKVSRAKLDEDFMPFTASTNAATILWGVASDGLDAIESYRQLNIESGREDLNLRYPCEMWMGSSEAYDGHVKTRVSALGWDHPIIKTQYRLIPVAHEGTFINKSQALSLLTSSHERELAPRPGATYEMLIDLAAGNEDFNPQKNLVGEDETTTDSTVIWIYEVTDDIAQNNIFPVCLARQLHWWTGVPLPQQEEEIKELINHWRVQKVTVDAVGVGRQLSEALEQRYGSYIVTKYLASATSVSEDSFDLLARLNFGAFKMFQNDGSPEWAQFEKQVGWTKYASSKGKMNLSKPSSEKHIDMVKALTYIGRNNPSAIMHTILATEADYGV